MRLRDRGRKCVRLPGRTLHRRSRTLSFVGALGVERSTAHCLFEGPIDGDLFAPVPRKVWFRSSDRTTSSFWTTSAGRRARRPAWHQSARCVGSRFRTRRMRGRDAGLDFVVCGVNERFGDPGWYAVCLHRGSTFRRQGVGQRGKGVEKFEQLHSPLTHVPVPRNPGRIGSLRVAVVFPNQMPARGSALPGFEPSRICLSSSRGRKSSARVLFR